MNVVEYARHRGVTREAVYQAFRAGKLPGVDRGNIDPVLADKLWARNTDATVGFPASLKGAGPPPPVASRLEALKQMREKDLVTEIKAMPSVPTITESRTMILAIKAQLSKRELQRDLGELVNKKEYDDKTFAFHRALRERFFSIPSRIAGILTAMDDIHEIEAVIRDELTAAMTELATNEY